jgi:hypothetical protein
MPKITGVFNFLEGRLELALLVPLLLASPFMVGVSLNQP